MQSRDLQSQRLQSIGVAAPIARIVEIIQAMIIQAMIIQAMPERNLPTLKKT